MNYHSKTLRRKRYYFGLFPLIGDFNHTIVRRRLAPCSYSGPVPSPQAQEEAQEAGQSISSGLASRGLRNESLRNERGHTTIHILNTIYSPTPPPPPVVE